MKKKPSPGPSIQHIFSPKRPVTALLVMTVVLSVALLFASAGQIYAASSALLATATPTTSTGIPTPLPTLSTPTGLPSPPTPLPLLNVTITSPSNGSVYALPAQIPLTVEVGNILNNMKPTFAEFYATLEPNGPTTLAGTTFSYPFSVTWVPPQAGTYDLMVQVEVGLQIGQSPTITVHVNTPSCRVSYQLESQWSGGFNVNAVLTNTGSAPINGWTLAFPFPGDQKITDLWNGFYTQTGEQVTITNLSYNSSIAAGGTVDIGFNGTWISNNTSPTLFTLNGMTCST